MGFAMPTVKGSKGNAASAPRPAESAFRQLILTFGLLERVMQPYFAQFGISGSQWGVLRALARAEDEGAPGMRLTDLGQRLLIRPPSVTGVVDRLQRAGLASRDDSPTDLRSKRVVLTNKGRQLVERVLAIHTRQIETVFGGLSSDDQHDLHQLLQRLGHHLEDLLHDSAVVQVGRVS
jgi:DNA-binding MarR family transcriptional regulator